MATKCHHFLLSDLSGVTAYMGVIIPSVRDLTVKTLEVAAFARHSG